MADSRIGSSRRKFKDLGGANDDKSGSRRGNLGKTFGAGMNKHPSALAHRRNTSFRAMPEEDTPSDMKNLPIVISSGEDSERDSSLLSDESQGEEMLASRIDEREDRSYTSSADDVVDKDDKIGVEDFAKPRMRKDR